jgi:hypothetical protein
MPWAKGTVAATKLKEELMAYIETLREQFPAKRHIAVVAPGLSSEKRGGTKVEIHTLPDEEGAWHYIDPTTGEEVGEEYHRVSIDVKADAKAGGAQVAEAVYGVLRNNLLSNAGRQALIARGIYNLRQSAEAPEVEDVTFERPLHLVCNTDTFLS